MKVDGERIYQEVALAIAKINQQKLVSEIANRRFTDVNKYMLSGTLTEILNGNRPVYTLADSTLYHIIRILNYELILNLRLDDVFTENEIIEANKQTISLDNKKRKNEDLTLSFKNFSYNGDIENPEWLGYMTYGEISEAYRNNKIVYKIEMQRQGTPMKIGNTLIMKPTIYPETISAIYSSMIAEEYIADMITFNITHNGKEKFDQKENGIDVRSEVVIADGAHRVRAIHNAVTSHPHLASKRMPVCVKNMTPERTRAFIGQVAKANRLVNEEAFDINSDINRFISDLNMYKNKKNNWLYKGITETITDDMIILAQNFRDGMAIGGWDEIIADKEVDLLKIKEEISNLYTMVYKIGNESIPEEILQDQSFLMGLLILGKEMYIKDEYIDRQKIESMIKFILKYKKFKEEYIFDIPLTKRDQIKFRNRYKKLYSI
ncbi:MAG: hypothetical protein ACRC1P_09805 [Cellulosilyticaceae bacterium]